MCAACCREGLHVDMPMQGAQECRGQRGDASTGTSEVRPLNAARSSRLRHLIRVRGRVRVRVRTMFLSVKG